MTTRGRAIGLRWAWLITLVAVLGAAGTWLLFTTFMVYDDEGYVLYSLQNFSRHGGLYDRVYTQYGPFLYILYDTLHRLCGFEFTNTAGRWITLVNWLGAALACAILVERVTKSMLWAGLTLVGTFVHLWIMIREPIHPGGLIAFLVAVAAVACAEAWRKERPWIFVIVAGVIGTALVFTKINVGVFFLASTGCWLAINAYPITRARSLAWIAAIPCTLLPFALMRSHFDLPWTRLFSLVFAAGALGVLLAAQTVVRPAIRLKFWSGWIAVVLLTTAALVLWIVARGTTLAGLLDGMVLSPLRHPSVYFFSPNWRPGTGVVALASLGLVAFSAHRNLWPKPVFKEVVAWIRAGFFLLFVIAALGSSTTGLPAIAICYAVPMAWILVLPLQETTADRGARAWIAFVLVFQSLHAYPVGGSQVSWGTLLWIPLLALSLHDASPILVHRVRIPFAWAGRLGALAAISVTLFMSQHLFRIGWHQYASAARLGLHGAENLRLYNDISMPMQISVRNARLHSDMVFSMPGLFSFNLWTGLPTPTLTNVTHWFSILDQAQQNEVIAQLRAHPRAVVLMQRDLLDFLDRTGFRPRGVLHDWLMQHYEKAISLSGYEMWFERGRTVALVSTARAISTKPQVLQSLVLTFDKPAAAVARIELCNIDDPTTPLFTFTSANSSGSIADCGLDGKTIGDERTLHLPLAPETLSRVTLRFIPIAVYGEFNRLVVVLRDSKGTVLDQILVAD